MKSYGGFTPSSLRSSSPGIGLGSGSGSSCPLSSSRASALEESPEPKARAVAPAAAWMNLRREKPPSQPCVCPTGRPWLEDCGVVWESPLLGTLCPSSKSLMLITVLLSESAQMGNTNAILPMTTVASAGAYLLSTPMALGPNLLLDGHAPYNLCFSDLWQHRPS